MTVRANNSLKILILGVDGYLGWPTSMFLASFGHQVLGIDNGIKRQWERELGVRPLIPLPAMETRIQTWNALGLAPIEYLQLDLRDGSQVDSLLEQHRPDVIVHYGEQPSAPYSMLDCSHAVETQTNNIVGTLNVIFAMHHHCPGAHLIKLGTMGEYGTPNIDIEEGFIEIEHKGRKDRLPFPKQANSFYHLSKVHDSHNLEFACRVWNLAVTDLNQGVVYGIETPQTGLAPGLHTSFHYDAVFGTALNRFCVQAAVGTPLTVYGHGGQNRGFLNIMDTLQCVKLSVDNPARAGEFRVFNQFTEVFNLQELAARVARAAASLGLRVEIEHLPNPRKESEDHYYNPVHRRLTDLGLEPHLLTDADISQMLERILQKRDQVDLEMLRPTIRWQ